MDVSWLSRNSLLGWSDQGVDSVCWHVAHRNSAPLGQFCGCAHAGGGVSPFLFVHVTHIEGSLKY